MRRDREKEADRFRALSLEYSQRVSVPPPQYQADKRAAKRAKPNLTAYQAYLASGEWRAFRISILAKRGPVCEVCSTRLRQPQIHHLTYERLGKELESDVVIACDNCHRGYHGIAPALPSRKPKGARRGRSKKFARFHKRT